MSAEEDTASTLCVIEEMFDEGNLDVADDLVAPDYVGHEPASSQEMHGTEGLKDYVGALRASFPDLHVRIEDQVAEGDEVATRDVASGTREGEMQGIKPTGRRVEISGIVLDRVPGGKLAERWDGYDALGTMRQLGVIPYPQEDRT